MMAYAKLTLYNLLKVVAETWFYAVGNVEYFFYLY